MGSGKNQPLHGRQGDINARTCQRLRPGKLHATHTRTRTRDFSAGGGRVLVACNKRNTAATWRGGGEVLATNSNKKRCRKPPTCIRRTFQTRTSTHEERTNTHQKNNKKNAHAFEPRAIRTCYARGITPFRTPKSLPILTSSKFVSQKGFPVVKALIGTCYDRGSNRHVPR